MGNVRKPVVLNKVYCDILFRIASLNDISNPLKPYLSEIHRTYKTPGTEEFSKVHPVLIKQVKYLVKEKYLLEIKQENQIYKVEYRVNYNKIVDDFLLYIQTAVVNETYLMGKFKRLVKDADLANNQILRYIMTNSFIEIGYNLIRHHDSGELLIQQLFEDLTKGKILELSFEHLCKEYNRKEINLPGFDTYEEFIHFLQDNHVSKTPMTKESVNKAFDALLNN